MTEPTSSLLTDLDQVASNAFGERYLFGVNRTAFQNSDASTVFRSHFGDSLFQENTFYVVAGTDSGLLFQFIKTQGVPKGSRYLFVELAQILDRLVEMRDPNGKILVTSLDEWLRQGIDEMELRDYAIRNRLVLVRSLGVVHGHYGEYLPFLRKLREEFDFLLQTYKMGVNNREFFLRQLENLTENQVPAMFLRGLFQGKTAVVLAGGPSLDDLLPWVKQQRRNLLVIAVSRISRSLIEAGIQPDICVAVDPYPIILNVSREMFEFQDGTLLVSEYHVCSNLLASWGGEKAYTGPRYPWPTPLQPENLPPSLGATVTNNAFALAIEAGVSQLILGGADFCFSQTGHTHAKGSAEHALGPRPMFGDQRVETNSGMMADTKYDFLTSARVIDMQAEAATSQGCRIINPAPGAMRLPHVEHVALEKIEVAPLQQPAREIIAASLPVDDRSVRIRFYEEVLGEIDRVLDELRTIKKLAKEALDYNQKLFGNSDKISRLHSHAKMNRIEHQLNGKYAGTAKLIKHYGLNRLILTLRPHDESEKELQDNNEIYFLSFVDTAKELLDILQRARGRVMSRLEEEKPHADVMRLIDQWRQDKQPGRAIEWAKRHAGYVKQLPEATRQALQAFAATFEESITELTRHYLKGIENEAKLNGLHIRARDYFRSQDEAGLTNLLAGLEEHLTKKESATNEDERHEQKLARHLMPLLQGFLAELHHDLPLAIETYKSVSEGPGQTEALQRLFELHTKRQDMDAALEDLRLLSDINPAYTPMYADLLNACGDVEQAVEIYTDYLLNTPDDLNSVMKLGKIYQQHGAMDGVNWAMNYILSKDPDNQAAQAMLDSLKQTQTHET